MSYNVVEKKYQRRDLIEEVKSIQHIAPAEQHQLDVAPLELYHLSGIFYKVGAPLVLTAITQTLSKSGLHQNSLSVDRVHHNSK